MSVDSDWDDIRREETALLARCQKFVLGSPDSPDPGPKDILYLTPCGRWLRIASRIAYFQRPEAGVGEIAERVDTKYARSLFGTYRKPWPPEMDPIPAENDAEVASELKYSII